uniref:Putative GTP diphosphokinase RSH2ic n=1 Tax=Rhizophora mucronata TaxID=61149 RepID=A0A2P2LVY0_RHIMU
MFPLLTLFLQNPPPSLFYLSLLKTKDLIEVQNLYQLSIRLLRELEGLGFLTAVYLASSFLHL